MKDPIKHLGFDPANYKWLYIGLAINILGFLLMIGGGSDDPKVFKEDELFGFVRITLSPMLIVLGYVVIFYAIMKRNNKKDKPEA